MYKPNLERWMIDKRKYCLLNDDFAWKIIPQKKLDMEVETILAGPLDEI